MFVNRLPKEAGLCKFIRSAIWRACASRWKWKGGAAISTGGRPRSARIPEKERRGQGDEGVYDPETSAYLSAVAAEVVFPGGLMALAGENALQSPEAILKEAIQSEKDSILFYSELAALCRDEHTQSVFMDIVSQERRHLATLQRMLMALAGPAEE